MKLLAFMGSPRKNGNTAELLNRIAKSAPENWDVEIIALADYTICGCTGCSHCQMDTEHFSCVQQDDGNRILGKVMEADAVLYGTPLYGHNYSGQMKILLDRHTPLFKFVSGKEKAVDEMEILSAIEHKPVGLVVSCQGPEEYNTELIKLLFDKFCESSLAKCVGKYIFPFCGPNVEESQYREDTLHRVWKDIVKAASADKK